MYTKSAIPRQLSSSDNLRKKPRGIQSHCFTRSYDLTVLFFLNRLYRNSVCLHKVILTRERESENFGKIRLKTRVYISIFVPDPKDRLIVVNGHHTDLPALTSWVSFMQKREF